MQVQALSELEEIIQYKTISDRRQTIRETWWKRLQVCNRMLQHHTLMKYTVVRGGDVV